MEHSPESVRSQVVAATGALVVLCASVAIALVVGGDPADTDQRIAAGPASATEATVSYPAATAVPVGHHGEFDVQYDDVPPDTRAQLDTVRAIIERYPTAADAVAGGWSAATVNLEGIAAHFVKNGAVGFTTFDGAFDLNTPEALLYDGTEPEAPIVGVSYLTSGDTPEGFAGPWDVWHRHDAVCFANGLVIAEVGGHPDSRIAISADDCRAQGGFMFPIANLSMIHVWMKAGFPSSTGVFAHDHSDL